MKDYLGAYRKLCELVGNDAEHDKDDFTATYNVIDDKLRLSGMYRFDEEQFQALKVLFAWAPKQECFVGVWSPIREDVCSLFAGKIEPDGVTPKERAAEKAARLSGLSSKRAEQSSVFFKAADKIANARPLGQPILVGHYSEASARADQRRIERNMDKACEAASASRYWAMRAHNVLAHAERLERPDVVRRRMEKLLKEFRDNQRILNLIRSRVDRWERIEMMDDPREQKKIVDGYLRCDEPRVLDRASMTLEQLIAHCKNIYLRRHKTTSARRKMEHLLNRLAYFRSTLPEVPRYEEKLTPAILQAFVRSQGAEKPKANYDGKENAWVVCSSVPLPLHIAGDEETKLMCLKADQWRDLMRSAGYHVVKKPAQKPLRNFAFAGRLQITTKYGCEYFASKVEMTSAEYKEKYFRSVAHSSCGNFRVRVFSPGISAGYHVVYLTDSKDHPQPETCVFEEEEKTDVDNPAPVAMPEALPTVPPPINDQEEALDQVIAFFLK